jgi:hypothetical protein
MPGSVLFWLDCPKNSNKRGPSFSLSPLTGFEEGNHVRLTILQGLFMRDDLEHLGRKQESFRGVLIPFPNH